MVVRDCALDSGTLTTDTELVRMSHCGGFYFDEEYVSGCVQSCFEDACNHARHLSGPSITCLLASIATTMLVASRYSKCSLSSMFTGCQLMFEAKRIS